MRRNIICAFLCVILISLILFGQRGPAPPDPNAAPASDVVIGSGNFSPIVADLERSLRFYNGLFGTPPPATIPAWSSDPALLNFLGNPTAQIRFSQVSIPGSSMRVEIVEFKDIDRRPVFRRLQDPGAVRLILLVRNLDTLLEQFKSQGVSVISAGAVPVTLRNHDAGRAVVVQDPDGFYIQLMQPNTLPNTTAPATSNVIGARFGLTISDTDPAMKVYRDLLGFKPEIDSAFSSDQPLQDLWNTRGAQFRRSTAKIPGSAVEMEFLEFKGVERKTVEARIQDPGSTRFQLRVRDTDVAVKPLVAAGGKVITTGGDGGPILMSGLRVAIVRELNNLFLVIMSQPPRPAAQ
jgi:predicted enzyme related to lactoylglutathione lyase